MHISSHQINKDVGVIEPSKALAASFSQNTADVTGTNSIGINLGNWCSNPNNTLDTPNTKQTKENIKPAQTSGLISKLRGIFGHESTADAPNKPQNPRLLEQNSEIPVRIRNIINHYRNGEHDNAQKLCGLVGTNNNTEIARLNTALENNQPWAREFMDIFDPSARIDEAIVAKEGNNMFRAKLLAKDGLNKEQTQYLIDNTETRGDFLEIVNALKPSKSNPSVNLT